MLEYERIEISEGIDVNKTHLSKECDICHYWHFKDISFKYEPYLCNGCHDLIKKLLVLIILPLYILKEMLIELNFWYKSKDDVINIINGSILLDKIDVL